MITRFFEIDGEYHGIHENDDIRKRNEFYGKSGDPKPTKDVRNADIFFEMDTGNVFLYDEDGATWLEV